MRQRLGLAAALLGDPELLILDEPANGLDPEGVRWLRDFLRRLAAAGRTVLISSHVLAEVAQTADRVLIISRGRLVLSSPLAELTARAGGAVRVRSGDPQQLIRHDPSDDPVQPGALTCPGRQGPSPAHWPESHSGCSARQSAGRSGTRFSTGVALPSCSAAATFCCSRSAGSRARLCGARSAPASARSSTTKSAASSRCSPGVSSSTLIAWAGALGVLGIARTVRQDLN
jgi:hypothetical protein